MNDDPIIEEVRTIRNELAARFNYDVKAIGAYYQARQKELALAVVSRNPRPAEPDNLPAPKAGVEENETFALQAQAQ